MRTLLFSLLLLALSACAGSTTSQGSLPPATAPVSRPPAATATPDLPPTAQIATPAATATPTAGALMAEATPTKARATPPPATPPPPPPFPPRIALQPLLTLPDPITYLTHAGDGSGRLFVVEKQGRVRIIAGEALLPTPFLDISGLVLARGSEQGLLSIAFAPDYPSSGQFYVNYTARAGDGATVIARYRVSADPNQADPATAEVLLQFDQPAPNHNGGQLQFGPDGFLYIGTGDGGSADDPWDNAENLAVWLGKMLRIDVSRPGGYAIPADNPFLARAGALPELWAYGLRNPWRFSFDRLTGDLYIADVGQNRFEEVNFQPAHSTGGEHYGWDTTEGLSCFEPRAGCNTAGISLPFFAYGHDQGCSVTGGYVYRGARYPDLAGVYLFGDFCSSRIWGARAQAGVWQSAALLDSGVNIASFGEDEAGELYVLDLNGSIYRLLAVE